jgi:triphosphoribosyl-dephospho-CoA synthetase
VVTGIIVTKPSTNSVKTGDPSLEEHARLQERLKLAFQNSMPIPVAMNICRYADEEIAAWVVECAS